jgi:uncharacterized membrane protein
MLRNPLTMNDWELKRTIQVVVVLQLALIGSVGIDTFVTPLPLLRPVIGSVFLLFVPGILILRIFKLHALGSVRTLVFAVSLSITTLMFTGAAISTAYPYLGIGQPLAELPLLITINVVVDALCVAAFLRDREYSKPDFVDARAVLSPATVGLCLIPFISIFGTYLMNLSGINAVLLMLLVLIAVLAILLTYRSDVPRHLYPLAVFVIALSLLYYSTLTSKYLWGWDINVEYYLSSLVASAGTWNPTLSAFQNSALSTVMFSPILSIVCGTSVTWVFKAIYPIVFALVPVGLYLVFQRQTNDKIAFLSAFFFVSVTEFFTELSYIPRQQIGELFIVALIILMLDKHLPKKNPALSLIFAFSLIVAHYSLAYIYIFLMLIVVILTALGTPAVQKLRKKMRLLPLNSKSAVSPSEAKIQIGSQLTTLTFVFFFIVLSQAWYMYVAGGGVFYVAANDLHVIGSSVFTDFLNPNTPSGLGVLTAATSSPLNDLNKYLYIITQLLIVVGIIALVLKRTRTKFDHEYSLFALAAFLMLIATLLVPFVSGPLNTSRMFQISLIFLAPFAVIGGLTIVRAGNTVAGRVSKSKHENGLLKAFAVFLAIFLLFNTGFVAEILQQPSTAVPLNATMDAPRFNDQEVYGASWLSNEKTSNPAFADTYRGLLLQTMFLPSVSGLPLNGTLAAGSYVYLGTLNVVENKFTVLAVKGSVSTSYSVNVQNFTAARSRVYDNGGSEIYYYGQ